MGTKTKRSSCNYSLAPRGQIIALFDATNALVTCQYNREPVADNMPNMSKKNTLTLISIRDYFSSALVFTIS